MSKNEIVYLVWHTHKIDEETDDEKLIGVYSTKALADNALARASLLEGFKDHIADFEVCDYELDKDHWTEGFITVS